MNNDRTEQATGRRRTRPPHPPSCCTASAFEVLASLTAASISSRVHAFLVISLKASPCCSTSS
eukprot:8845508-Pyramimonas_sp.AAC.1